MKQKRAYEVPVSEVVCFEAEDVITTSGGDGYISENTTIYNGYDEPKDVTWFHPES